VIVRDDAKEPINPAVRWREEVGAIYDLVSISPRVIFQEAGFMPVSLEAALRVQRDTGLNISDCLHIMDTDSIRHIIKYHGSNKEILRGQEPLVREDLLLIPQIVDNPDAIENGGKTKPGRDTVRYSKNIDGVRYYYTEELRTKKNRLAAVTFYKREN
jgi:hypothetical protein